MRPTRTPKPCGSSPPMPVCVNSGLSERDKGLSVLNEQQIFIYQYPSSLWLMPNYVSLDFDIATRCDPVCSMYTIIELGLNAHRCWQQGYFKFVDRTSHGRKDKGRNCRCQRKRKPCQSLRIHSVPIFPLDSCLIPLEPLGFFRLGSKDNTQHLL